MTTSGASTPHVILPRPRIVLLGRPCDNTTATANILHDAAIPLEAVILADPWALPGQAPALRGSTGWYRVPSPRATRRLLAHLQPDLAIAACYPWRLSRRTLAVPRLGMLNIHPSPLPHGRGPDPVFWVFRNGERDTGVTVHLMDEGLDTGPILAQQRLVVPGEMDAVELELRLFETGARLVAEVLPEILAGSATYAPQDHHAATYQPHPSAHDWIISPLLPAAWAWRFARGVAPLYGPLMVQTDGKLVPVREAISWGEDGRPPGVLPSGVIAARFSPGWVLFEQ